MPSFENHNDSIAVDTALTTTDSVHVYKWQWETLPQVSGMFLRDSLPEIELNGFHKKSLWQGTFENYVKHTGLYHKELPPTRPGEAGIPVEYSISNDSVLSMGLFLCILLTILMLARSSHFVSFQIKNLFRTPREDSAIMRETSSEMRYQVYFSLQGVFLLGLFAYALARNALADGEDFSVSDYQLIGIYVLLFLLYRMVCELLEAVVLPVYFSENQRMIWAGARLFLTAMQGVLLLPLALVFFYFQPRLETTLLIGAAIIGVTLVLRTYKVWRILFQKKDAVAPFLLYISTMRMVPLALLAVVGMLIANYLKINI